jgi:23S rRNA pseudouridine2605 synthase
MRPRITRKSDNPKKQERGRDREKSSRNSNNSNKPAYNSKANKKNYTSKKEDSYKEKREFKNREDKSELLQTSPHKSNYSKSSNFSEIKTERRNYKKSKEANSRDTEKRAYSHSNNSFKRKSERSSFSDSTADSDRTNPERRSAFGRKSDFKKNKEWSSKNDELKNRFDRKSGFNDETKRTKRFEKSENKFDQDQPKRAFRNENFKSDSRQGNSEKKYGKAIVSKERKSSVSKQLDYTADNQNFHKKPKLEKNTLRLNKYIANAGICSRREADELIKAGVVTVNGKIVTEMGYQVNITDIVHYGSQKLSTEKPVYILLNKPKDYITTLDDPQKRKTVLELIAGACKERVYPVGRLDRNTTGLLLLTNDGEMAAKLTHPRYGVKKIYHVELTKNIKHADLKQILEGVRLDDGEIVKADDVSYTSEDQNNRKEIGIEIHSGQNRVVRRIFESLDYEVAKLDRVYFAGLTKKDLPRGRYRFLTEKEIVMLKMLKA